MVKVSAAIAAGADVAHRDVDAGGKRFEADEREHPARIA